MFEAIVRQNVLLLERKNIGVRFTYIRVNSEVFLSKLVSTEKSERKSVLGAVFHENLQLFRLSRNSMLGKSSSR